MTVAPTGTETVYVLIGTNVGPFATVWPYAGAADISVHIVVGDQATLLSEGTDFTVTGATPLVNGGAVLLNAGLVPAGGWASSTNVCLSRASQTGQPAALGEAVGFSPKGYENALDFVDRQIQDLWGPSARALGKAPGAPNYNAIGLRIVNMADGVADSDAATVGEVTRATATLTAQIAAFLAGQTVANVKIMFSSAFPRLPGEPDDSARCQRVLDAAGSGGVAMFESGTYTLSATLHGYSNMLVSGAGPNSTIFRRQTAYGDTLRFAEAGASIVQGIWFFHGNFPANTSTPLTGVATDGSAHISMVNGQAWTVRDCWLWRMPYGVRVGQGAMFWIRDNIFSGVFDRANVAAQEGIASVLVGADAYTQIGKIIGNYFAGMGSAPRNITWTATDGAPVTVSLTNNCGPVSAIAIDQCEDLIIQDNYIGGSAYYNINGTLGVGAVGLEWRILNNMFDSAGPDSAMINVTINAANVLVNGLTIQGNQFNGETVGLHAITFSNAVNTSPAVANFVISGNTCQALVGSFAMLNNAAGGVITGNSITSYNCRNVSAGADVNYCAAVWGSANATGISALGNTLGGAINSAAPSSYCYQGIVGVGIAQKGTLWNGAGAAGTQLGKIDLNVVTITGNYTLTGYEDLVRINAAAALTISVPATLPPGYSVELKDVAGNAAAHSTTVQSTVDGVANPVYATNRFAERLHFNGTSFDLLAA